MRAAVFVLLILFFLAVIIVTGDCTRFGAIGGLFVAVTGLFFRRKTLCPKCGKTMPPCPDAKSLSDWWKGDGSCPSCGAHVSHKGRLLP